MCVEVADGRTDGRAMWSQKRWCCCWKTDLRFGDFDFFLLLFLRTGDSRGEEQQRATTDSGLVAPARP